MKAQFNKFDYQLVESTHKGFKEVLVTFEYKGKSCHYYSFIKEKPGLSKAKYIEEAKKEIKEMIKNGDLAKRAKRYLNYPIKKEDKLTVVSKTVVSPTVGVRAHKTMPKYLPFLLLSIVGLILLGLGAASILRSFILGNWPEYVLDAEEKYRIMLHLYIGIGLGVLGLAGLGVGIPLFIKKRKK